jgi:hypothetical protein
MNCTVYGTLNCLETLFKRLYGKEINKSERYIGIMAKTSPGGNSPHKVIEEIRSEAGLIDECLLPFDDTINIWEEYYSPDPMTEKYKKEGKKFLDNFEIRHEWVFQEGEKNKKNKLKDALKCSPLGVSVLGWEEGEDGLFTKEKGELDNHWVELYGYEEGKFWKVFDHYDDTYKKLTWDYDFGMAKRYYLKELELKKNWLIELLEKIKNLIKKWGERN